MFFRTVIPFLLAFFFTIFLCLAVIATTTYFAIRLFAFCPHPCHFPSPAFWSW